MMRPAFHRYQRLLGVLLCLWLILGQGVTGWAAEATPTPTNFPSAPARSQIVRVLLSRLNITDRIDLTLDGIFSLGNHGENSMIFERGSELTILLKNDSLIVYYKGMSFSAGRSLFLTRYLAKDGMENGIRITGEPALYEGDLQLNAENSLIRATLHIHVEDYLHGVVPYEMSNAFPLEALKAQAIAARTYALRKQDPAKAYDLVDTTNDQVFKGKLSGYDRSEQAVNETRGICGFYKDQLAECFYAASNGGQTDLVEHVWGQGDYGYYKMIDDPYDLENPQSLVKTYAIPKKGTKVEDFSHGLRALLVRELAKDLRAKGYDPSPESLLINEVLALSLAVPAFAAPSRVMTEMSITFKYSGRTRTDVSAPVPFVNADEGDVSLFATSPAPTTIAPIAIETVTPPPTPVPTPKPIYGEFEAMEESVTLQMPVFPDVVNAAALSLNGSSNNEIITVAEDSRQYTLEARRYGHGVGMSQRGAEWMASQYGKTYLDILSFYYPGMTFKQYPEADAFLPILDTEQMATPGPRPTPTPRPTLIPVTAKLTEGAWYAVVSEIADDSTLNLRAAPDLSGEILLQLLKDQRLLVMERCEQEGWVKVKTDAVEGYVMEKFLKAE